MVRAWLLAEERSDRIEIMCRLMPSSVSSGKNSQPWWRVMRARKPFCSAALSSRNEMVSVSMSGSLPTRFGFAWWRVCLFIHHE
ncbi:hypothetical protein D3C74_357220 [compost metagenome]